jgi:phosphoglycolate phosphatase
MAIQVIVFDFDGTLVQSNPIKRQAYFQLFPADDRHQAVIRQILDENFEASRYVIFEQILRALNIPEQAIQADIQRYAERYNEIVVAGVKTCPECLGAGQLLEQLHSRYVLYLSSTTPETSLQEIIAYRKWHGYFKSIFGYPRKKADTLRDILTQEQIAASELMVVGDGESDRTSAQTVGGDFFPVQERPLATLIKHLKAMSNEYILDKRTERFQRPWINEV